MNRIEAIALQDAGEMFGCPPGIRIDQYARHVRKVVVRYNALNRVAKAAEDYFAEHQEDGEGVPQPQLAEMLAALDELGFVDALAAGSRRAETPSAAQCEASQSGDAKAAQRPTDGGSNVTRD